MPGNAGAMLPAEPATAAEPLTAHEHPPAIASHHVPPEPPPGETLREHSRKLIEETLAAQEGNVSQAARQLGVSRGTLYRRLRGWREQDKGLPPRAPG